MKRPILILTALSALIFSANVFAADKDRKNKRDSGERHHREQSRDQHHQNHRDNRQRLANNHRNDRVQVRNKHNNKQKYSHNNRRNDYKRSYRDRKDHHSGSKYFLGGLIVGSLANAGHYVYDNHGYRSHRISFWMDSYGDCYRVEHRRGGKVYVEVPQYKCY